MWPRNCVGTQKQCGIAHEMTIKHENDEFLVSPLNRVPRVTWPKICAGTPKHCVLAHETAIKR
jgi:hypothetical protein